MSNAAPPDPPSSVVAKLASFATTDDGGSGGAAFDNTGHAPLIGVFNGCFFINSTSGKPTFANSVAASTTFGTDYNTGSNDGIGFVNDNPNQEYVGKADASAFPTYS